MILIALLIILEKILIFIMNEGKMVASSDDLITKCEKIMTKFEVFQQYLSKMEELKEFDENSTYYNEPLLVEKMN